MKTTLLVFFCLLYNNIFAQLMVDTTVKHQYESAYKTLPLDIRQNIERTQKAMLESYNELSEASKRKIPYSPLNIAVVTLHSIDTLNKDQIAPDAYIYEAEKYSIMFCEGGVMSDTLVIFLYPGVAQNSSIDITHLVVYKNVQTKYDISTKYDTVFSTSLNEQEKTNDLILPATTKKFVLSDSIFIARKTVYGYADIETNSYYQDTSSFKSGYIARRLHFKYYFKFVIKKRST